jgi:hypothetical protein
MIDLRLFKGFLERNNITTFDVVGLNKYNNNKWVSALKDDVNVKPLPAGAWKDDVYDNIQNNYA